ncbi:MAG TPA: glycosyltransferase family 39 protein [Candidatus Limnocylindrales bacterium]|nr:glycosyltransferase family 39 protein [Candidatus Limnocylindrales bacterium]
MHQTFRRRTPEFLLLAALGVMLFITNRWITIFYDEVFIIRAATEPVSQILHKFWVGEGIHEHPPLFDVLFHFWLRLTGASFVALRLPGIAFYLFGLWMLSRTAVELGGTRSARAVLWIGALWPYGYHYGRMAAWYSFCFAIVAWLTYSYIRLVQKPSVGRWCATFFLAAALVYTNYFGWAMLACLAIDFAIRERANWRRAAVILITSGSLLALAYLPLWRSFFHELGFGIASDNSPATTVLLGGFEIYNLFVSESVAPWFLALGIPACLCIAACLLVTFKCSSPPARRFLIYGAALLVLMTLAGIINAKRLLPIAAWLLLPIGLTLESLRPGRDRIILSTSIVGILLIGWYGIFNRTHYSAPRFIEPWQQVGADAANHSRAGALIIGNNPSFFFYLIYALVPSESPGRWQMLQNLSAPGAFDAQDWMGRGQPLRSEVFLVRGAPGPLEEGAPWDAEQWLDKRCRLIEFHQMAPDPASTLKAKFMPESEQLPWRIRVRQYSCSMDAQLPSR